MADDLKPALLFMPDQVLGALEQTIRPLIESLGQKYAGDAARGVFPPLFESVEHRPHRIVIADPPIDWAQSLEMTRNTIEQISAALAERFDEAIRKGWIKKEAGVPGQSGGTCFRVDAKSGNDRPGIIEFCSDGTISDPVYLTHEAGHLIANDANRGPPWADRQPKALRAALEIQAFFFQHAFYDAEIHPGRTPVVAHAIALHRRAETLSVMARLEKEFVALDESKDVRTEDRITEAGFARLDGAYALHSDEHSGAYFVSAGLWRRYKDMMPAEKAAFLSVLYPTAARNPETGGIPSLEALLALGGIREEGDLKLFLRDAGRGLTQPVGPVAGSVSVSGPRPHCAP